MLCLFPARLNTRCHKAVGGRGSHLRPFIPASAKRLQLAHANVQWHLSSFRRFLSIAAPCRLQTNASKVDLEHITSVLHRRSLAKPRLLCNIQEISRACRGEFGDVGAATDAPNSTDEASREMVSCMAPLGDKNVHGFLEGHAKTRRPSLSSIRCRIGRARVDLISTLLGPYIVPVCSSVGDRLQPAHRHPSTHPVENDGETPVACHEGLRLWKNVDLAGTVADKAHTVVWLLEDIPYTRRRCAQLLMRHDGADTRLA